MWRSPLDQIRHRHGRRAAAGGRAPEQATARFRAEGHQRGSSSRQRRSRASQNVCGAPPSMLGFLQHVARVEGDESAVGRPDRRRNDREHLRAGERDRLERVHRARPQAQDAVRAFGGVDQTSSVRGYREHPGFRQAPCDRFLKAHGRRSETDAFRTARVGQHAGDRPASRGEAEPYVQRDAGPTSTRELVAR